MIRFALMLGLGGLAFANPSNAQSVCVHNAADHTYFFAVEAGHPDTRRTGRLKPGEELCTEETTSSGTVSVFETENSIEGCSRLVPVGQTEDLKRYTDFDRCLWSSNS